MGEKRPGSAAVSTRVLLLVEGQTEERFAKDILGPALANHGIFIDATILSTKRIKNGSDFKGGVSTFNQFERDLRPLLHSGEAIVSTIVDYYGLPADFPGMSTRPNGTPYERVAHVEAALKEYFQSPRNFIPYLSLHEFESLLFSSPAVLPETMTASGKADEFARICRAFPSPEEINENPDSAPSKRIQNLFPAYRKTLHGPNAVKQIGLNVIRSKCPHFNTWFECLVSV